MATEVATRAHRHKRGHKKPTVLGSVRLTIPAGTTKLVTVHLNSTGRTLLKKQGNLTAVLTLTINRSTTTRTVRFRRTRH
jgi:hypothetical protein